MTIKKSDVVKLRYNDCRMLMIEGINRPVRKQLCVLEIVASGTVWFQEEQGNLRAMS